jgi:hypothetical protein
VEFNDNVIMAIKRKGINVLVFFFYLFIVLDQFGDLTRKLLFRDIHDFIRAKPFTPFTTFSLPLSIDVSHRLQQSKNEFKRLWIIFKAYFRPFILVFDTIYHT